MRRDEREGLLAYRFETLPDGVDAFVSTRLGGVSSPPYESLNLGLRVGDDAEKVVENRRRLFRTFGISLERSVWCEQVHGNGVVVVDAADAGRGSTGGETIVEDADALVTDTPGLMLCVTMGDCAPVAIVDPERRVVGLAHAGWRGTVSRIASQTVRVMRESFGSDPAALVAAVGPSIGPSGYETGEGVVERASEAFGARSSEILVPAPEGKAYFDLWAANRIDLEEAGVSGARIEISGVDSGERLGEFYSHRREGGQTGRFIAAICAGSLALT